MKARTYKLLQEAVTAGLAEASDKVLRAEDPSPEWVNQMTIKCVMDNIAEWFVFDQDEWKR